MQAAALAHPIYARQRYLPEVHTEDEMRQVSVGSMIKQISGMLGTKDLSIWEADFVRSVDEKSGHGADTSVLSDKQVEMVDTIFRKNFS